MSRDERAERIRRARKDKNLTQRQLAAGIGVSVRTVQEWEAGTTQPRNHNLLRLSRALGIAPEELS